ncbi:SPOSA6832_02382 [Sporobolomyces salmonicolor]|uniref:SPOSA6832_02382-mRNA-1:cds n=1 Tax=Sporidiobolus salmonicolor TaxID=5005 RepID=A0A0D6EM01_SPOSA|nr:SPOSA6832_02382 [Sporobolomyces salmonicolor]
MPVLEFAPPAPSGSGARLSPSKRSPNRLVQPQAQLPAADQAVKQLADPLASPFKRIDASTGKGRTGKDSLETGDGDEDDVSMELAMSQGASQGLALRGAVGAQENGREARSGAGKGETTEGADAEARSRSGSEDLVPLHALPTSAVPLSSVSLHLHIYQPPSSSTLTEFSTSPHADEDGDTDVPAASVLELPSLSLEGVWDSLIYDGAVKEKLLGYIYSTMLFSDASVDFNIVTWNRVVLLHGPPGTGKTSLCRALAQKLAIRLSDRYEHGKLIEINSHSLFSKWFSESGKLVQRLFAQVTEMVEDENAFVVVLIDEVESLTAARAGAMSGKEPSDALRVVNALLTQLDKLKHRKNCLVMTTSNLSGAIDNAFIDRADIKQYIGLPPTAAVYWILQSCLNEIMRAGLVPPVTLYDYKDVEVVRSSGGVAHSAEEDDRDWKCSEALCAVAEQCQGMSGRTLRRLPVLAHARHIGVTYGTRRPRMEVWLDAMRKCVEEEGRELEKVEGKV